MLSNEQRRNLIVNARQTGKTSTWRMIKDMYASRTKKSKDDWETPPYFYKLLWDEFHFTLDAAASMSNRMCEKFYSKHTNALVQNWDHNTVFCNPPYGRGLKYWVKKCYEEAQKPSVPVVVMIIPSRTDTRYWHDYVMKANEIRFCKGRVNFLLNHQEPKKGGSNFPLAVIVFKGEEYWENPIVTTFEHKEFKKKCDEKSNRLLDEYKKRQKKLDKTWYDYDNNSGDYITLTWGSEPPVSGLVGTGMIGDIGDSLLV